ncbi:hypothetical protein D3C72_1085420 [compost metagenome]
MRVGILKTTCATLQATRLVSSCEVQAISMSVSAAPASASTSGLMPLPTTPRRSKRVSRSRRRTPSVSMTVMSFFSPSRLSATLSPTRPAPKIRIFIKNAPRFNALSMATPCRGRPSLWGNPVLKAAHHASAAPGRPHHNVVPCSGRVGKWRRQCAVGCAIANHCQQWSIHRSISLALRPHPARCT